MTLPLIQTTQLKFELSTENQPIEATVWCEPQERKDMSLHPGDITRAIEWFREQTGQEPRLILVHPTKEGMARESAGNITVETRGGVLASEVWLSPAEHFVTPLVTPPPTTEFLGGEKSAEVSQ